MEEVGSFKTQYKAVTGRWKAGWATHPGGHKAAGGHLGAARSGGSGMDDRSRRRACHPPPPPPKAQVCGCPVMNQWGTTQCESSVGIRTFVQELQVIHNSHRLVTRIYMHHIRQRLSRDARMADHAALSWHAEHSYESAFDNFQEKDFQVMNGPGSGTEGRGSGMLIGC